MHIFQKNGIFGFWFGNRTESKSDVRKCTLRIKYENLNIIHSTKNTDNDTNLASKLMYCMNDFMNYECCESIGYKICFFRDIFLLSLLYDLLELV